MRVDLSRETDFEAPTSYDMYDEQSLGRMKFEKAPDAPGLGELSDRPRDRTDASQAEEEGRSERWRMEPMMTESSFTAGPSSQPSFTELPSQAPHAPDHAPWMDVSAQIDQLPWDSYGGACLRFERIEERMDQQQATFEHLKSIDRIESRQASQHEEMMAYLRSVFPPPPPQP
ncbi:hypothetical protein CK203_087867 [Vitis vinifera]|uniref:Uncharacterized protein n=1 Tax=Vitis vinifera TaxID=29760 RepID=A0A438DQR6_VITVI|nr:hypothetical protein CK203_087867 [Vitis vinifera]